VSYSLFPAIIPHCNPEDTEKIGAIPAVKVGLESERNFDQKNISLIAPSTEITEGRWNGGNCTLMLQGFASFPSF